jgi:hypothetical protein
MLFEIADPRDVISTFERPSKGLGVIKPPQNSPR